MSESGYDSVGYVSPDGTEWAYGNCAERSTFAFDFWRNAIGADPLGMV